MTSTLERLAALERRIEHNSAILSEIHAAVVGDGSKHSSLRERVTALEVAHTHETSWKYRGVSSSAIAIVSAGLAFIAHQLTVITAR
jgi:hypothetical protein